MGSDTSKTGHDRPKVLHVVPHSPPITDKAPHGADPGQQQPGAPDPKAEPGTPS